MSLSYITLTYNAHTKIGPKLHNRFQIGGEAREIKGPRTFLGLLTEARGREPHLALSLGVKVAKGRTTELRFLNISLNVP